MPATKKGIFHNLRESKYTVSNSEIVFFFSSRVYMKKFLEGYKNYRRNFLGQHAKVDMIKPINMETYADITYYIELEKRGFYAWIKGVETDCESLYKYALRQMTKPNTLDWQEIQKPKLGERLRTME